MLTPQSEPGLLFRASFPGIFSSFRILYDIGWTYVILAEMVNARRGVGYMVEAARKMMDFERVYAGIIAIAGNGGNDMNHFVSSHRPGGLPQVRATSRSESITYSVPSTARNFFFWSPC